jgi:hypothetical protein
MRLAVFSNAVLSTKRFRYELDGLIEKAQFSPEDSARANALVQQASSFSSAGHDPATFPPKDSPTCQGDSSSSSGDDRSSSRSSTSNSGEDEDEEKDAAEEANPSETLLGARPLRNEVFHKSALNFSLHHSLSSLHISQIIYELFIHPSFTFCT